MNDFEFAVYCTLNRSFHLKTGSRAASNVNNKQKKILFSPLKYATRHCRKLARSLTEGTANIFKIVRIY